MGRRKDTFTAMIWRKQHAKNTLAIDDDGDDVEVLLRLEHAFGVKFGDPVPWITVGDAYDALLGRVPATDQAGKCATTMAFYQLRRALRSVLQLDAPIRPSTRLSDLTRRSPKRVFKELSRELGFTPGFTLSWIGGVGVLFIFAGLIGLLGSAGFHRLWPAIGLLPLGLVMVRLDPGTFGSQTVGDLARAFATQNYRDFAERGADQRPEAIWSVLVGLLGEFSEMNPAEINRETRLLA